MGPAVTLEKTSSIGAKRYFSLPLSMLGSAAERSTRRHSGSAPVYNEEDDKPSDNLKNLKRQWSFDCVLRREFVTSPSEDDSSSPREETRKWNHDCKVVDDQNINEEPYKRKCKSRKNVASHKTFTNPSSSSSFESSKMEGRDKTHTNSPTTSSTNNPVVNGNSFKTNNCSEPTNFLKKDNENLPNLISTNSDSYKVTEKNENVTKVTERNENVTKVDEQLTTDFCVSRASDDKILVNNLTNNNLKLSRRADAILRKVVHLHKKKVHVNLLRYLTRLETLMKRGEMSSKSVVDDSIPRSIDARDLDSDTDTSSYKSREDVLHVDDDSFKAFSSSTDGFKETILSQFSSFPRKSQNDSSELMRRGIENVICRLQRSLDPDATDDSSEEEEEEDASESECNEGISIGGNEAAEMEWVRSKVDMLCEWRRLEERVRRIDKEMKASKKLLKRMNRLEGGWFEDAEADGKEWARCDSNKIVISLKHQEESNKFGASRCVPVSSIKRRKIVPSSLLESSNVTTSLCTRCAVLLYNQSPRTTTSTTYGDQINLSQVIWERVRLARQTDEQSKLVQSEATRPSTFSQLDVDHSRNVSTVSPFRSECSREGRKQVLHKSKSTTRFQLHHGNQPKKQNVKSSSSRTSGEVAGHQPRRSHASNFDINNIILLPTNSSSSRLDTSIKKKDIDVPMWRYASSGEKDQEEEADDTSDDAYVRRHLEPEMKEKMHRLPGFSLAIRRHQHRTSEYRDNVATDDRSIQERTSRRRRTTNSSFDSDVFVERPGCHGDGSHRRSDFEAFDWSSTSHQSDDSCGFHGVDDKSLDRSSWFSVNNRTSNLSTVVPFNELPTDGNFNRNSSNHGGGDFLYAPNKRDNYNEPPRSPSCSTASACSPLNFDLHS